MAFSKVLQKISLLLILIVGIGASANGQYWTTSGNTGSSNFIGTTDNQPFIFKTNNSEALRISPTGNLLVGTITDGAFKFDLNGAMRTTGEVIFGNGTGYGWKITGEGGYDQIYSLRAAGAYITAYNGPLNLGGKSGYDVRLSRSLRIFSDNDNADGLVLTPNTINTVNKPGTQNLALGASGGHAMLIAQSGNVIVQTGGTYTDNGYKLDVMGTFRATSDALINGVIIGRGGGNQINNTAIGNNTLTINTGTYNTAVGAYSLNYNTSGTINTAVGYAALFANTSGVNNTGVGANALGANTIGENNSAVGYRSLASNVNGYDNTSVGYNSLPSNNSGYQNSALGSYALTTNTTGYGNAAFGYVAEGRGTTGSGNAGFGHSALYNNTTGNNNTSMGSFAGSNLTSGDHNIFIGAGIQPNISNTASYQLNIGNWIFGNNGSIGIGAANPAASAKMEINSTTQGFLAPRMTSTQKNAIATPADGLLVYDNTIKAYNYYNGTAWQSMGSLSAAQWTQTGSDLSFSTGNVSIGTNTTVTDYKLAVAGGIIAEKVKVKLQSAGWPDFVFEKDYELPTLQQVAQFIEEHKHLPGVPSAKEVGQQGLDIGNNQAILLKKIEEMTLYMIQQQKEIDALKEEVRKLKND